MAQSTSSTLVKSTQNPTAGMVTWSIGVLLLCLWFLPTPARGQGDSPASQICLEEAEVLREVESAAAELTAITKGVDNTLSGRSGNTLELGQLLAVFEETPESSLSLTADWPKDLLCGELREDYQAAIQQMNAAQLKLAEQRENIWLRLPEVGRTGLRDIWSSLLQLRSNLDLDTQEDAERALGDELTQALSDLAELRWTYATLLTSLNGPLAPADINLWLARWRAAMDTADDLGKMEGNAAAELTEGQIEALRYEFRCLQLHAASVALAFNRVRAYLWREYRPEFRAALAMTDSGQLLIDETRAIVHSLRWLYLDTAVGSVSDTHKNRSVFWQVLQSFEYLLGLGALVLLGFLAKRTEPLVESWQENFATRSRGNRRRTQWVKFSAGMTRWIPWLTALYGLGLLRDIFLSSGLFLLLPVILFARLYVIYGLLCLCGEWFLRRMAELAGHYLNDDDRVTIAEKSRHAALLVLLPWFLQALVRLTINNSLLLSLLDGVTALVLLVAFGILLKPWREEFVRALQYFLPTRLDDICEKLFGGPAFIVLAPLVAPLLVVMTLISFLHKLLVQFDWYRRVMARSFLLRSALPEDAEVATSHESSFKKYQSWFDESALGQAPRIKVQIVDFLQSALSQWLNDQSDENTLVLTGHQGSGKTTALDRLQAWIADQPETAEVIRLTVPAKSHSPEALAQLLEPALGVSLKNGPADLVTSDTERAPTVIILDDAQNLFLRTVGGLAGWESLLTITRASTRHIYWIVAIDSQSWAYLANVFGGNGQFNVIARCRPWSQSEIRSLILSRHQLSGLRLTYDQILLSSRGPEAGSLRNAEQLYFSLLWDACKGNPALALRLWLTSLVVRPDNIIVGLPDDISGVTLERLEEDHFFVYAALVLHENLNTQELQATTALPDSTIRSALRVGIDRGFVERGGDSRYRILPLWYFPLMRILARKNLLHE